MNIKKEGRQEERKENIKEGFDGFK